MEQRTANIKSANSTAQAQLRLPPAYSLPGLQPGSQRPASSFERQHKRQRTALEFQTGAIAVACVVGIASEDEGEVRVLGPPLEETLGYPSPWPPPPLAACLRPSALPAVHPPSPSQPPPLCDPSPNLTPEDCDDGGVSLCDPVSSAYVYQQVHDMVCQMQRMTSQMAMLLERLGPLHTSLAAGPAAPSHLHTKRNAAARCRSPPPAPHQHQPDPHAPTSMQGTAQACTHPYPWASSGLPLPQPQPPRLPQQQQRHHHHHHHHPQQQLQRCQQQQQQQQDSRAFPPQQQQQQQDKLDQVMQALPPQQQRTARHRAQRSPPPTTHPSPTPPPMPHQEPMQGTGPQSLTPPHTTATTAATTTAATTSATTTAAAAAAAAAATPKAAAAGCAGAPPSRSTAGAGRQVQEAEAAAVEALLLQAAACCPPQPNGSGRRTSGLDQLAMAATAAPITSPWSPPTPQPLPQPQPPQPLPATQPLALDAAQLSKQQRGAPLLEGHKRGGPGTQPQSPCLLLPSDPPCNPPTPHHAPRSPGPQTHPPSPHPPDISHSPAPRASCPSPAPLTSTSRSAVQASQLTQASRDDPGQVLLPAPLLPPPAAASSSAAQSLTRASTPSTQTRGAARCQPGVAADAGAVAAVAAAAGPTAAAGVAAETGTQARQQQGGAAAPKPAPNQADTAAGKSWPAGSPGSGVLGAPLEGSEVQGARPPCPVKVEPEPCLGAEPPGPLAACPHPPKGPWAPPLIPQALGQEGAQLRQGPRGGPGARGGCQPADSGEVCDVPLGAMQGEGQLGGRRSPGGEQLDLEEGEGQGEGQGEGERQGEGQGEGQEEGLEEGEGQGQQQVHALTSAPVDTEPTGPWQLCDSMAFFKQLMESQPQPQLQLQTQPQQQQQLQLQPQQQLMAQVPDELRCDASAAANMSMDVAPGSRPAPGSWPGSLTSPPAQHQPSQLQPFHLQQQPVLQLSGASNAGTQQQLHSLLQHLRRSKQVKPARNDRNPPKPGTVAALLGRAPSLRDSVASQAQFGPGGRSGFTPPDSACRTTVDNGARVFQTNGITPAHLEPCADDGLEAGGRAGDDSGAGEEGSATGIYKQRRRGNAGRDEQETNGEGDMLSSDRHQRDRHQRGGFQRRINKSMLQEVYHLPIQEAAQHLRMGVTVLKKYCRSFKVERWPFRKLQSLDKLIQSVQEQQAMEPSIDLTFTLSELQRFKAEVYDTPEVALDERIKRLRQANFKQVGRQDYKQRQVLPSPDTLPSPPLGPPGRAHNPTVNSSPSPSLTLSPRSPLPSAPSPSPPLTALHQPRAAGQPARPTRPTLPPSPDAWPAPSLAASRPGPSTHPL
ncbi:hypothetical protein QJQ45_024212, partial [Haematococcus lacustris]